jgi:hypothetical protein
MLYREALSTRSLNVTHVTDTITKTVNCIVARALKQCERAELLIEAVDTEYGETAGHTNVRWLGWPVCFETSF